MASKLEDARKSLVRAQEAAKRRLDELDNERREIKGSMKSLDAAIKALSGSKNSQAADKQPMAKPRQEEPGFDTNTTT